MEYKQLSKSERYYIEQRKSSLVGISLRQLAREIGRSHATVSCELRRNLDINFSFYSGIRAYSLSY